MKNYILFYFLIGAPLIVSPSAYAGSVAACQCKNGIYLNAQNQWNIVKGSGGQKYLGRNDKANAINCVGWGGVVACQGTIDNKKVNNPQKVTFTAVCR